MFGIDDALIWAPLAGAAIGGLASKNPLKGAALGGAIGYGGAALPGLLGASATPTAAAGIADGTAGSFAPMSAADFMKSKIAESATAPTAEQGLLSSGAIKSAMDYVKPIGTALSAGMQAKGLLSQPQQPIQASPVVSGGGGGSASLTQLAAQGQQQANDELAQAAQARAARRQMFRGGY